MTEILDLRPGIRVWFGGASWEVVALYGLEVTLRSGPSLQRVAVTEIAAHAVAMAHKDDSFDPTAVVLSSLTTSQRHKLDVRAGHVRSALAAVNDDGTNLESVLAAKAKELDVSVRTLYRWIAASGHRGSPGWPTPAFAADMQSAWTRGGTRRVFRCWTTMSRHPRRPWEMSSTRLSASWRQASARERCRCPVKPLLTGV